MNIGIGSDMIKNIIIALFITLALPIGWYAFDRQGPYDRLFGVIIIHKESDCEIDGHFDKITPGACVGPEWRFDVHYEKVCIPRGRLSRTITDSEGTVFELPRYSNTYGANKRFTEIMRTTPFVVPRDSARGWAKYKSAACYVCNPLQWAGIQDPVCENTPDIYFVVE